MTPEKSNFHGSKNQNQKQVSALAAIKTDPGCPGSCPYHRGYFRVFAGSWFLDDPAGTAGAFCGFAGCQALEAASGIVVGTPRLREWCG